MTHSPIVGLVEEVVVGGERAATTVLAKCDTGAKRTSIDLALARDLGLGEGEKQVRVRSSNGVEKRSVYAFEVDIQGTTHEVLASVTDRSAMRYDAIVGRDVLQSYLVDSSLKKGE
ncbi:aspartyl protease family protein [Halobium salinum]|uniref:Aspartyl protease family protein n=1 Tax=Halobium salinum TaxID=1364940 RepID=A0ABD5PCN7_9EURY|nr:aspartyl protease family protein [Halobium salinum]